MDLLQPNREVYLKVQGKTWIAEIATPRMSIDIDLAVARRIGGVSLESLPGFTYGFIVACKTLEVVLREAPPEFRKFKSIEDYPDPDLIAELFKLYEEQSSSFREELKKNRDQDLPKTESRSDSRSVHDPEVPNPPKRNRKPRGSVRRTEELHPGIDGNTGGFQSVSRNQASDPRNPGSRENGSEGIHPGSDTQFASGRGRIFPG